MAVIKLCIECFQKKKKLESLSVIFNNILALSSGKTMIPCSEQEFYYKLDNMVLTATQHLRKVFVYRWKTETDTDWVDDQSHVQMFLESLGQNALKKAQPYQKSSLKSKSLQEWDMTLLSLVLQNFGDDLKYKKENSAVYQLKKMRNDLAHHSTKQMPENEYQQNVNSFRFSLKALGVPEDEITKLIERAGVTSSLKAFEHVKKLFSKAETLLSKGQTGRAAECYTEAIETPSLLPVNLSTAYEKRAEYYLQHLMKDPLVDMDKWSDALLDVTKALELNDSSWTAHYLAGKCHRWKNDVGQAVHHYERALAISPSQKEVKRDLDCCKVLAGQYFRDDCQNPSMMPISFDEIIGENVDKNGKRMTKEEYIYYNEHLAGKLIPGQDDLFRGHRHFYGWDAPQNFTQAVKHYGKAASKKNPEGMWILAMCYHYGHGVKQDIEEALRFYREVVEMDPSTLGNATSTGCNVGVASARHSIGHLYELGIGMEQDFGEAAKWYQRSMDDGVGSSAFNLGIFYSKGQGVPRDDKMAEMCWKQALNLGEAGAPAMLMTYYIVQLEPDMARNMLELGRKMGHPVLLSMSDEEFNRCAMLMKYKRMELEPALVNFEREQKLEESSHGLTFKQRIERQMAHEDPAKLKLNKICEELERLTENKGGTPSFHGNPQQSLTYEMVLEIDERAKQGSEAAARIMTYVTHSFALHQCLNNEKYKLTSDDEKLEILNLLYVIVTLEISTLQKVRKLNSFLADLFERKCEEKGEWDMKTRLCFVSVNLRGSHSSSDDMLDVELLKEGIRRYPDNISYYEFISYLYHCKNKYQLGKHFAEEGLKREPRNWDLIFLRAKNLHPLNGPPEEKPSREIIIGAYQEFLDGAPVDHRQRPNACYIISSLHLKTIDLRIQLPCQGQDLKEMEFYYRKGLEAEKTQLPCYLPVDSMAKSLVEGILNRNQNQGAINKPFLRDAVLHGKGVLVRKEYLKSPMRKALILSHRRKLDESSQHSFEGDDLSGMASELTQRPAKKLSTLKLITLQEMRFSTEINKIFEDRFLELTIIDEPNTRNRASIQVLGEDESGDLTRVYIFDDNVSGRKENLERLKVGCRLAIINPYMRKREECSSKDGIVNVEPKCIVYLEKVENICRFCGEENATRKCAKCKRSYCSRECQELDWKDLKHKLICSLK